MTMTKAVSNLCPKWLYVDGHATAPTVTGMKAEDTIINALHFTAGALTADLTTGCVAGDGSMTCSTDTTGDKLLVLFHSADGSAGGSYANMAMKCCSCTGAAQGAAITCTGIEPEDTILLALHITAGAITAQVANSYITISDSSEIKITTYEETASDVVLVFWLSANSTTGTTFSSPCIKVFKAASVTAPATAITCTGIEMEDTIIAVLYFNNLGVYQSDDTAQCTVSTTVDGKIYSSTTFGADTHMLAVIWHDASA